LGEGLSCLFWIAANAGGVVLEIVLIREGIGTPKELRWAVLLRRRLAAKETKKPSPFEDLDGL
jgi:hypothetical protein